MVRLLGVTLAVVVLLQSGPGVAAGDDAERLTNKAIELRQSGDDQGALPLFERAYALSHSPRAAAQLGLCQQALGRWADAETNLSQALKAGKDPWIKKQRRPLEDALVTIKAHIARLEIVGEPADAEVSVNGNVVGRLPLAAPVRVGAGEIQVELRAPGYAAGSRSVRVDGGQYQKIALRLEREAAPPPPPVVNPPPPVAVNNPPPDPRPPPPTDADHPVIERKRASATGARKAAKWVAHGGAVLGVGAGIYGTAQNGSLVTEFDGSCGIVGGKAVMAPGSAKTDGQCADLKNQYELASHIGIGGFVAAGLLAVTGLVLWLTEPSDDSTQTAAASYRCAPLLTPRLGLSAGCVLRF
jgi:hypothetical protein